MTLLLIVAIYVLGCVMAYGRINAFSYAMNEQCGREICKVEAFDVVFSWLAFTIWVYWYFQDGDKYFLKFRRYKG